KARVAKAKSFDYARAERLDEHVGAQRQVASHLVVGRVLEVEDDALLAPAHERVGGLSPQRGAARRLDLDNTGAEVGQCLARLRACPARRQVQRAEALERQRRRVVSLGHDSPVHGIEPPKEYTYRRLAHGARRLASSSNRVYCSAMFLNCPKRGLR